MTDDSTTLLLSTLRELRTEFRTLSADLRRATTLMEKFVTKVQRSSKSNNTKTAAHVRQTHKLVLKMMRSQSALSSRLLEDSEEHVAAQRRDHMYTRPERKPN